MLGIIRSHTIIKIVNVLVCLCVVAVAQDNVEGDETIAFRSLFTRVPDMRMMSFGVKNITGSDVRSCAKRCVKETEFECKSFDFVNVLHLCRLHVYSYPRTKLQTHIGTDHYKTAYEKLYTRIPHHVVTTHHNRWAADVTVEECARFCYLERNYVCRGFDYMNLTRECWMTEHTPQTSGGVQIYENIDYYEREPVGPLRRFINYGFGSLNTGSNFVYKKEVTQIDLEECAKACLEQPHFHCWSFDYNFTERSCRLASVISANVGGMTHIHPNVSVMHYEHKGHNVEYFYPTPYTVLLGHNDRIFNRVTPEMCARYCLMERSFICRSFDYQIEEGSCRLSKKTGSDVGGLFKLNHIPIHHFEMKPILDCGGNLTTDNGDIASPNWPRQYAPHEHCTWYIRVSPFKVIRFMFTHFYLGQDRSGEFCDEQNDHLVIREGMTETCMRPGLKNKRLVTESNEVSLSFYSNAAGDAPGFRVFYESEWPCKRRFVEDGGVFASPDWPHSYPAGSLCDWLIEAPPGSNITLLFTHFDLDNSSVEECRGGRDHVIIFDGESEDYPAVARYCGTRGFEFTTESSSNVMRVQFVSYIESTHRAGFHARYWFNESPTTTAATTSTVRTTTTTKQTTVTEPQTTSAQRSTKYDHVTTTETTDVKIKVRSSGKPSSSRDDSGESTMWGVVAALIVVLVLVAVSVFVYCRKHRKRVPKICQEKNRTINAEASSLCDQHVVNTPAPSPVPPPLPPRTTSFANPLYGTSTRKSSFKKLFTKGGKKT